MAGEGRAKGSRNKRSGGLLAKLREDYDLDPLLKMAEICSKEVPVLVEGEPVMVDGEVLMTPYLEPANLIQALKHLGDKTYPTLKAQEIAVSGNLPVIEVKMTGFKKAKNADSG